MRSSLARLRNNRLSLKELVTILLGKNSMIRNTSDRLDTQPAYEAPRIDRVDISKTETGVLNPTEFLAIIGPTS
mgnify:CR=1 FL=1